ncbi:Re/Si-specific NAD(P)(+) transhydrogenase subunit alpha [Legionella oakridgensis]|uniref:NAD(P) transhydrogenase subunit alpha part 1 n=1 Tax=Legionella oakridgensis ATCC 33761 = DSM 21215 TaxID=1268635 RepID=W0BAG4_9GAMM|nr:Re/Si-specific NAD(P)(+) transhydrogenase subunit alpha [Legionella oakridgensis]AHE66825.1 NAD/NADP transhydrogenase alpha subunit [Legionella oakridgensis ATCC 33761 = DSM 21215]STY19938.1 NAD(P) transhydrogenase subunit alpha [Legionella longbeachae]
MIIAAMHEGGNETRVAITPAAVKRYTKLGFEILCEHNAGKASGFNDKEYEAAGAEMVKDKNILLQHATILLCVNEPSPQELKGLAPESLLIAPIDGDAQSALIIWCLKQRISVFSMNHIPRISRAQSMDSLSSQANLAGYRAVLEGATHFNRALPMMMTAAGMIQPAKVLVLGAGVAGLQAIATAKRLGAVVYAFDVRTAVKEQVESLGAEFIEVSQAQDAETSAGYAGEVSDEYRHLQAQLIDQYARLADIIICTALIPGKKAPVLLKAETVERMKPGSVIVDLATSRGGNCELSERDAIIRHNSITIVGYSNMAGLIPATASELYANNLVHLVQTFTAPDSALSFNEEDEIIRQGLLCHDGQYLPFHFVKEH